MKREWHEGWANQGLITLILKPYDLLDLETPHSTPERVGEISLDDMQNAYKVVIRNDHCFIFVSPCVHKHSE